MVDFYLFIYLFGHTSNMVANDPLSMSMFLNDATLAQWKTIRVSEYLTFTRQYVSKKKIS
jgi:hypothetical protein